MTLFLEVLVSYAKTFEMMKEFEMSMFGEIKFFVGLQINQLKNGTFITQFKYMNKILKTF